jgi:peptidoglycan hydrolase-like protein with peptidoglycan-binding domain
VKRLLPWVVLVALVAVPGAGLAALALNFDDSPSDLVIDVEPVLTQATERVSDGEQAARLSFDVGDPAEMISSGGSGIVTDIHVEPGDVLGEGDPVFSVDGVERRIMVSDHPLHRDLEAEARGADIVIAEKFLNRTGYLDAEPDDFFGWETVVATREFESDVGVAKPTSTFGADLVVWLPEAQFEVGEIEVRQGRPVPSVGEPVLSSPKPVTTAKLQDREGGAITVGTPSVVEFRGEEIGRIDDAEDIPAELIQEIYDVLGSEAAAPDGDSDDAKTADIVLRFVEPVTSLAVPSSAVMVTKDGDSACVWTADEAGLFHAQTVTVLDGTLGSTDVDMQDTGRDILANPLEILTDPACPSP